MTNIRLLILIFILSFTSTIADAQILAWEMNGNAGNEVTVNSTTTDPNLGTSPISRGVGIDPSALANGYSSTNFAATSLATAITANEYIQFTVTPNTGFKVSLSTLDANFRRSGTGPTDFQWQYSLDGFATAGTNVGPAINYTNTATNGIAQTQIDLSGIPALQDVAFPNTITFRLFGWNASATGGTFAIGRLAGNDLAIGGMTMPITTAASGLVAGRVLNNKGRGLRFVTIMITGNSLPEPLYASTNMFGRYQFEDIPVGESYVLQVFSKRYSFKRSSMVFNLNDNIFDANFIGFER